ncbi:hypothetical protein M9H77_32300 [Catharanthus roseus]|uniref:Uncharacterized protein n=1 Tax=Catharanthus roseus TaxID=4058 RepID=A0ACC0A4Y9_CATRO|nr:hypothetical protein M9H77_32300 [Catharanthus roseus]
MAGRARLTQPSQRRVGLLFLRLPLLRDLSFTDYLTYSTTGTSKRLTDVRRCSASTAGLVVAVFVAGSDTAVVGKFSVSVIPFCFYTNGPCRFTVSGVRHGIGKQERRRSFSVIV